jgi:hypothetical protein
VLLKTTGLKVIFISVQHLLPLPKAAGPRDETKNKSLIERAAAGVVAGTMAGSWCDRRKSR